MILSSLPDELLITIISNLHRSPPKPGTPCTEREYHQHDLVILLTVNKRLFRIVSKILYTHPIVDDPYQFLLGIDSSSSYLAKPFCKIHSLDHVKYLDMQHKLNLRDEVDSTKYAHMEPDEKALWEENVLIKSAEDLGNCDKAYQLIEQHKYDHSDSTTINIMPNLITLRVGAWDDGWWVDKMKQISFNEIVNTKFKLWINPQNRSKGLSQELTAKYPDAFKFAKSFIDVTRPKEVIQYIQAGPISFKNAFHHYVPLSPDPMVVISRLNFDIDRNTINFFPSIVIGALNKWYIHCTQKPRIIEEEGEEEIYIDRDGLMVTVELLLKHISKFTFPTDSEISQCEGQDAILEVYNMDSLEYKEYDDEGNIKLIASSQWIGDGEDHALDAQQEYPTRICEELGISLRRERWGPWGMMELTKEGIHFVDVRSEEQRLSVYFK